MTPEEEIDELKAQLQGRKWVTRCLLVLLAAQMALTTLTRRNFRAEAKNFEGMQQAFEGCMQNAEQLVEIVHRYEALYR